MLIGRYGIGAGRANARCFQFAGLQWTRFANGGLCWLGLGRVLVFYVRVWRES